MKKTLFLLAAVFGFSPVLTADNLVVNGEFERLSAQGVALNWSFAASKPGSVKYFATGAPDGGYAQITMPENGKFTFRQIMTGKLVANTKYEVSFKMRCTDFTAAQLGVLLINDGWKKGNGVRNLKPTAVWTKFKYVITMPELTKYSALVFYSNNAKGTLEIADIEVEPFDND